MKREDAKHNTGGKKEIEKTEIGIDKRENGNEWKNFQEKS